MSLPYGKSEIPVFISATDLRAALGTTKEDGRLTECAMYANRQITMAVKPYADATPVVKGSSTFEDIVRVGLLYAQYLWYLKVQQPDMAESFYRNYTGALKDLKEALRVEPTPRQEPLIAVRSDFLSERKIPYSMIGFAGDTENLY